MRDLRTGCLDKRARRELAWKRCRDHQWPVATDDRRVASGERRLTEGCNLCARRKFNLLVAHGALRPPKGRKFALRARRSRRAARVSHTRWLHLTRGCGASLSLSLAVVVVNYRSFTISLLFVRQFPGPWRNPSCHQQTSLTIGWRRCRANSPKSSRTGDKRPFFMPSLRRRTSGGGGGRKCGAKWLRHTRSSEHVSAQHN